MTTRWCPSGTRRRRRGTPPASAPRRSSPGASTRSRGGLERPETAVLNLHCPPRDTNLDQAPQLDADLRPIVTPGGYAVMSVGATAVREAIERSGCGARAARTRARVARWTGDRPLDVRQPGLGVRRGRPARCDRGSHRGRRGQTLADHPGMTALIDEGMSLAQAADAAGLKLRLLGGVGVVAHCPTALAGQAPSRDRRHRRGGHAARRAQAHRLPREPRLHRRDPFQRHARRHAHDLPRAAGQARRVRRRVLDVPRARHRRPARARLPRR